MSLAFCKETMTGARGLEAHLPGARVANNSLVTALLSEAYRTTNGSPPLPGQTYPQPGTQCVVELRRRTAPHCNPSYTLGRGLVSEGRRHFVQGRRRLFPTGTSFSLRSRCSAKPFSFEMEEDLLGNLYGRKSARIGNDVVVRRNVVRA